MCSNDYCNTLLKSLQYSLPFHEIFLGQICKNSRILHLQCDLVVRQIFSDSFALQYNDYSKLVPKDFSPLAFGSYWKTCSGTRFESLSDKNSSGNICLTLLSQNNIALSKESYCRYSTISFKAIIKKLCIWMVVAWLAWLAVKIFWSGKV